jgi:chromosome segregation ATPase
LMGRSGSHKAKSGPPPDAIGRRTASPLSSPTRRPAPDARIADLEAQLASVEKALESQKSSYDEDTASFEKTLSRLAQSERSLSQTKARLVDAEALARTEQARAEALSAELAAVKANAAAELALARQSASAVEAREQQALTLARAVRFEQAANLAELEELQGKVGGLQADNERLKSDLQDCRAEVAGAAERNTVLTHERTRLLDLLAALDVLAREVAHLTSQAAAAESHLPKVEGWLGRDVEAEHIRATLRPEGFSAPVPKPSRTPSAPEITVTGAKL